MVYKLPEDSDLIWKRFVHAALSSSLRSAETFTFRTIAVAVGLCSLHPVVYSEGLETVQLYVLDYQLFTRPKWQVIKDSGDGERRHRLGGERASRACCAT